MKPHIHARLIKAWADGAEIEFKNYKQEWVLLEESFCVWNPVTRYRIKPEKKSLGQIVYEALAEDTTRNWPESFSRTSIEHYEDIGKRLLQAFKDNDLI